MDIIIYLVYLYLAAAAKVLRKKGFWGPVLFFHIKILFIEYFNSFSTQSPILPLRLLVPARYPECSPVILDKLLDERRFELYFKFERSLK
jgi:hypothetical protein